MKPLKAFWIVVFALTAYANPAINSNDNTVHFLNRNQLEENFLRKLNTKCSQHDNHSCMMLKLIVYMNRLFKKSTIEVSENLKVTQNRGAEIPEDNDDDELFARAMNSDDESLGMILAEKIWRFIRSRSMRYKLYDNADVVVSTEPRGNINLGLSISPFEAFEEGRGKMKQLAPIIAVIATKIGVIGALVIKGLILLTGKALIISKIALILSVIIALKKLLAKKHVTYEVVAHPHATHETAHPHDSYSAGWARALDGFIDGFADVPAKMLDAHRMAFAGQKPEKHL